MCIELHTSHIDLDHNRSCEHRICPLLVMSIPRIRVICYPEIESIGGIVPHSAFGRRGSIWST